MITGRTYLERGEPVTVLIQWGPGGGPRNVLIERGDGTRVVRPFRADYGSRPPQRGTLARMRVTIELPEGWGPRRLVLVQMERLGYDVTEHIDMGTGMHWLTFGEPRPAPKGGPKGRNARAVS